jgi:hypothetical protein
MKRFFLKLLNTITYRWTGFPSRKYVRFIYEQGFKTTRPKDEVAMAFSKGWHINAISLGTRKTNERVRQILLKVVRDYEKKD